MAEALGAREPEFAHYQDEPPQMPSGTVGKSGYLKLGFERRGTKTILADLDRRVPYLAQRALYFDEARPDMPCVFLITTSGSVLQGDRLALDIALARGAEAHVTTQAATKIHAMDANYAAQTQSFRLDDDAYLEFLPDPVIPHRGARFLSDTRITIAPSATLLYSDILLCGRKHHRANERFGFEVYSAAVAAARPGGHALFADKFVIEPHRRRVDTTGTMGGYDVLANVFLLTPKAITDRVHVGAGPGEFPWSSFAANARGAVARRSARAACDLPTAWSFAGDPPGRLSPVVQLDSRVRDAQHPRCDTTCVGARQRRVSEQDCSAEPAARNGCRWADTTSGPGAGGSRV